MADITPEARLALLCISRQYPNAAEVLRHEIETKAAEVERLNQLSIDLSAWLEQDKNEESSKREEA